MPTPKDSKEIFFKHKEHEGARRFRFHFWICKGRIIDEKEGQSNAA